MKFCFLWMLLLIPGTAWGEDTSGIEALLNQAESSLSSGSEKNKKPKKNVKRSKPPVNKTAKKPVVKKPVAKKNVTQKNTNLKTLQAFPDSSVKKLLTIEKMSLNKERGLSTANQSLALSVGMNRLGTGYEFSKDDDRFRNTGSSLLTGGMVKYEPYWRRFSGDVPFDVGPRINAGLFVGEVASERTGVVNESQVYTYYQTIVDLDLFVSALIRERFILGASYGYGVEYINQQGSGQFDSVSEDFIGSVVGISAGYRAKSGVEWSITASQRGVTKNDELSGRVILMAMKFPNI